MWTLHVGVAYHPLASELKLCSPLEGGGDYCRGRNAPFFKGHRVVHTAQRTRTSTAQPCNRDVHLLRHIIYHLFGSWLGVMLLSAHNYAFDPVPLA